MGVVLSIHDYYSLFKDMDTGIVFHCVCILLGQGEVCVYFTSFSVSVCVHVCVYMCVSVSNARAVRLFRLVGILWNKL